VQLIKPQLAVNRGQPPKKYQHFAGAVLKNTDDPDRRTGEGKLLVQSMHAGTLSCLALQMQKIYRDEVDYSHKRLFLFRNWLLHAYHH